MEDRDGKKTFIIPKTHSSSKDVLISEKTDSRNVIELFNDMKSCALELHFDFRENQCKSCDMIRNQKLQKLYNERKIQMKKERDPTERFAFHLIPSRDIALNIANDGLNCEQLSFTIDKYLGNPKDGIHLSRRPDVLLASSGRYKFGLLVCKVILGKGYPTIPSINNKQFSAQLHYDYHFCKIQSGNKEQRHIDDLLANSLIFCYEHEEFQTLSHPSQILPLAILWYDLTEKFPTELTPTSQESQQRKTKNSYTKKLPIKPLPPPVTGTWEEPIPDSLPTTPTKYPNQLTIPYSSLYTSFGSSQPDPRLIRPVISSETIPLSPQNSTSNPSFKQVTNEKHIPLTSTTQLIDPRLKTFQPSQKIFYLESKAVKHAVQQQKRLNNYYGSTSKTNYTLIPFHIRSTSSNEDDRHHQLLKNSSTLSISVIDCFQFGLRKSTDQLYIDLEEHDNQIAYGQIQISNRLIEQERELNSQEIRLHLREKRQRKIQEQIHEQKKNELANSKFYIQNGRKVLKEHQEIHSTNNQMSLELLDFFSNEYRHEKRPQVKRILAELLGIFLEKYGLDYQQMIPKTMQAPIVANQTINSVIDMELESSPSQGLNDHDERFRVQTPPTIESTYNRSFSPVLLIQTSNTTSEESNNTNTQFLQPTQIELPLSEPILLTDDVALATNIEETEVSSNENKNADEVHSSTTDDDSKQIIISNPSVEINLDSSRSRNEFVKLLTQEAYTTKSPSPPPTPDPRRRSHDEDDEEELNSTITLSSTRTVTLVSDNHQDNLIIETTTTTVDQQNEEQEEEQPTVKRIKVDLISPLTNDNENLLVTITDDHDYRQDLDERKRQEETLRSRSRSRSRSTSSHHSSIKDFKTNSPSTSSSSNKKHHQHRRRRNDYHRSYHYHQRNLNNSISSHHQRFNYNHQSVAEHPRFAHIDTIPSPEKNFNYNSFSTSNYSQARANTNRNLNSSYYNESPSDYQYYQDNYNNTNLLQPPPLMSNPPLMNFSNSYESKPSNTIERLQMLLENRNTSYDYSSLPYGMHSTENLNNHHWSTSRGTSNGRMQNNPTFTCNDAEQLLTFVQHLRN